MTTLIAKSSFQVFTGAAPRVIQAGAAIDSDDPAVAGREHLFRTVEEHLGIVEAATANPGERRTTRRPAKARERKQVTRPGGPEAEARAEDAAPDA